MDQYSSEAYKDWPAPSDTAVVAPCPAEFCPSWRAPCWDWSRGGRSWSSCGRDSQTSPSASHPSSLGQPRSCCGPHVASPPASPRSWPGRCWCTSSSGGRAGGLGYTGRAGERTGLGQASFYREDSRRTLGLQSITDGLIRDPCWHNCNWVLAVLLRDLSRKNREILVFKID